MIRTIMAAAAAVALSACKPAIDRGVCLEHHTETIFVPQYITVCSGSTCMPQFAYLLPIDDKVCDRWEFPNGRPSK